MNALQLRATVLWAVFLVFVALAMMGKFDAPAWLQCLALVLMFLTAFFCEVTATGPKK